MWKCPMFDVSDREFFSAPIYSKFAEECYWNNEISQNVLNLVFFWKNDGFFEKERQFFQNRQNWQIFSAIRIKWNYSMKMTFPPE